MADNNMAENKEEGDKSNEDFSANRMNNVAFDLNKTKDVMSLHYSAGSVIGTLNYLVYSTCLSGQGNLSRFSIRP